MTKCLAIWSFAGPRSDVNSSGGDFVPARRKPNPALVEQVPRALRCASRALTARLRVSLRKEGLPFSRFVVLRLLVGRGATTSKTLAEAMGVTTANLPGLIDRLEADGLVTRTRNGRDRREILVEATPKGRKTFLRLKDTAVGELGRAFEGWTDKELRTFLDSLNRFSRRRPTEALLQLKVLR
jgi:DNA-binding MarR family transcriptional regulator